MKQKGLTFRLYNGKTFPFKNQTFDVVLCTQVYEHVVDIRLLASEMYRVLKQGGVCLFAGMNKFCIREPHHNLLFLSWLPYFAANAYVKLAGTGTEYYERPISLRLARVSHYVGGPSLQRRGTRMDGRFASPTAKAMGHPT